jgi:hypothetical protein
MSIKSDCLGGTNERERREGEGAAGKEDQCILGIY